jgi:two-component system nitrate/nitrite response regulator NarL
MYVVVADDNEVVRKAICHLLEVDPRIAPCIEAANGEEAVELARQSKADAVVLDLSMPVMNGLDAARRIRKLRPRVAIILCSLYEGVVDKRLLGIGGASAVISKRNAATELLPTICSLLGLDSIPYPAGA